MKPKKNNARIKLELWFNPDEVWAKLSSFENDLADFFLARDIYSDILLKKADNPQTGSAIEYVMFLERRDPTPQLNPKPMTFKPSLNKQLNMIIASDKKMAEKH